MNVAIKNGKQIQLTANTLSFLAKTESVLQINGSLTPRNRSLASPVQIHKKLTSILGEFTQSGALGERIPQISKESQ